MSNNEEQKRFILWDKADSYVPRIDENGKIMSDGLLGRLNEGNVYLTTYASYPDKKRPADLEVGGCIPNVQFSLSGSSGTYDVYRVS
jgi:hypothetical protein